MVKVTISGPPGSGTSTLVEKLSTKLNWSSLNGGEVFREEAKSRGISVEQLSEIAKSNLQIDKALDDLLKNKMASNTPPDIIESRLSGWWASELELNCYRVWISVSDEERAKRIQNREGGNYEDCLVRSRKRQMDDKERYLALYGIDLDDLSPYNLIIDADKLDADDVFELVYSSITGVE